MHAVDVEVLTNFGWTYLLGLQGPASFWYHQHAPSKLDTTQYWSGFLLVQSTLNAWAIHKLCHLMSISIRTYQYLTPKPWHFTATITELPHSELLETFAGWLLLQLLIKMPYRPVELPEQEREICKNEAPHPDVSAFKCDPSSSQLIGKNHEALLRAPAFEKRSIGLGLKQCISIHIGFYALFPCYEPWCH